MATTTRKRELSLNEQAVNLAVLEAALHPEHLLDRSRPSYAMQHDPEGLLKALIGLVDRDAWQRNDIR